MSLEIIGATISKLRKEKCVTQEDLANSVGVSIQAVSKWECGGSPDAELLPAIADYFGISIDKLFGRKVADYSDLETETVKHFASVDQNIQIDEFFKHCWNIQQSMFGNPDINNLTDINEKHQCRVYSQVRSDNGNSLMSLREDLQYLFLIPEPPTGLKKALCDTNSYKTLFALLGDSDVLDCLLLLDSRENKPFTPKLLENNLGITTEKATDILESLEKYSFIKTSEVELDDTIQIVYNFTPNPVFSALLVIATNLIQVPNLFYCYSGGRTKPYLS